MSKNKQETCKEAKDVVCAENAESDESTQTPLQQALAFKHEGNACFLNKNYEQAANNYGKAIEICPVSNKEELAVFYQNRAAANEKLNKWADVKEDCARALDHNPVYVKAYKRRARAYEACDELQACLDDATAVLIFEKFESNSNMLYVKHILNKLASLDNLNFKKNRKPMFSSNTGIRGHIEKLLEDPVLTIDLPESEMKALAARGYVRAKQELKQRRYENIIPACDEELAPGQPNAKYKMEALLLRGTFNLMQDALKEALDDCNAVIHNKNADKKLRAFAYMRRAEVNLRDDKKELCFVDMDAAERLWPSTADVYFQRAMLYRALGMLPDSLKQLGKVLEIKSDHGAAYAMKASLEYECAVQKQDPVHTLSLLEKVKHSIQRFPTSIICYEIVTDALLQHADFEQADRALIKALELDPAHVGFRTMRAICALEGNLGVGSAEKMLKDAILIDPRSCIAIETLASVQIDKYNFDYALELLKRATKLYSSNADRLVIFSKLNWLQARLNVKNKLNIDVSPSIDVKVRGFFHALSD